MSRRIVGGLALATAAGLAGCGGSEGVPAPTSPCASPLPIDVTPALPGNFPLPADGTPYAHQRRGSTTIEDVSVTAAADQLTEVRDAELNSLRAGAYTTNPTGRTTATFTGPHFGSIEVLTFGGCTGTAVLRITVTH